MSINNLKEKYLSLHKADTSSAEEIRWVENALSVSLPDDFKEIATFYTGGFLGGISHHAFFSAANPLNIVSETLRLRKAINLAKEYIVLAEPAESLIVMNLSAPPAIIWCDANDAEHLGTGEFSTPPDYWENYASFFSYLLEREASEDY
ncbi:SMI1/KNR4 family protein [Pseudomonas sp. DOAB1069]|uniref:SMI1/KNR4 family protein n=1 Tax=Pseudomonas folii TaxID=2762593 RepID=A0ABR7AVJ5_9PSED|nr:SMI1/KNR4 family protein [Pseudomonas folii]